MKLDDGAKVLLAFAITIVAMCTLVLVEGCKGNEQVILQLGTIGTGLGGALAGIARTRQQNGDQQDKKEGS